MNSRDSLFPSTRHMHCKVARPRQSCRQPIKKKQHLHGLKWTLDRQRAFVAAFCYTGCATKILKDKKEEALDNQKKKKVTMNMMINNDDNST